MPTLAKQRPESKTTDIDLGYGPIRVTYRPRQIVDTGDDEGRRREDIDNFSAYELCRIVSAWDLTGPVPIEDIPGHAMGSVFDGGEQDVIPLTYDIVRYIDQPFVASLLAAITVDAQPDPTKMLNESRGRGSTRTPTPISSNGESLSQTQPMSTSS